MGKIGYSVRELAKVLNVPESIIYLQIRDGDFPCMVIGKNRKVILPCHLKKQFGKEVAEEIIKGLNNLKGKGN